MGVRSREVAAHVMHSVLARFLTNISHPQYIVCDVLSSSPIIVMVNIVY